MALLRTAVLVRCARAFVQSSGRRSYTPSAMTTVGVAELAERAKLAVLDPQRNAVKERLPAPQLGIFNDIPRQQFRESDARALALAGFSFVVNDAEHGGPDCVYGREENAMLARLGLTPLQRLPREALSAHGDALCCGARGTMRPYGTTLAEATDYLETVAFPAVGSAGRRSLARGAFPVRKGDGSLTFTEDSLRDAELGKTLPLLQFETEEYLLDAALRGEVLAALAQADAGAFVGAFDAGMRARDPSLIPAGVEALCGEAEALGVVTGGVVGGPTPEDAEANILTHLRWGMRLVATPVLLSDVALHGALAVAAPFHAAVARL